MGASFQPLIGALRIGKNHDQHGDPWEVGCLCALEGDTAHLFLVESEGRHSSLVRERDAIRKILPEGIKWVRWERTENGETKLVTFKL